MNASEGLSRLAKALKWIGIGICVMGAAIFVWGVVGWPRIDGITPSLEEGLAALLFGLPGALLMAIAWIVDGFAQRREDSK